MRHPAAEAVQPPDDLGISLLERGDARVEPKPLVAGAGRLVLKSLDAPRRFQCVKLHPQTLIRGTDPGVSDQRSHAGRLSPRR